VVIKGKGTAEKPISVRAATPGKLILTGNAFMVIDGEHLDVSGLQLKDCTAEKDGIAIKGSHNRVTDCAVIGGRYKFFVHFWGIEHQFDHNYLAEKTSENPTLQVEVEEQPNKHLIAWNHFGHRPPLGKNGGETMRVGYSHQSMRNSQTIVEHNLFERCDGEIEIISSKSCENVYRYNTFLECDGMLTLRHGNRCVVDSNYFLGHHKKGSGGVRVIGEDHTIVNNYFDGLDKGAFWITSGVPNSELKEYFCCKRAVIAFTTVVDSRGFYIDLSAGFGTSKRSLMPEDVTIANNIFAVPKDSTLLKNKEGERYKWFGNFTDAAVEHAGVKVGDLKLEKDSNGLWRPSAESPVRGAAEGEVKGVTRDIAGRERKGKFDAGCWQNSDEAATNRPLNTGDVGPSWMHLQK